jgi:Ni,Fe-hydrogenase I large subunit
VLIQAMIGAVSVGVEGPEFSGSSWIASLALEGDGTNTTYVNKAYPTGVSQGFGATEAPRGALAHFCTATDGLITAYQCVVPTTWNGSPKDTTGQAGPIEQAMIGIPFDDGGATFTGQGGGSIATQAGVEALRVAQSFDPCIACAVH